MKLSDINISKALREAKQLSQSEDMPSSLKSVMELLVCRTKQTKARNLLERLRDFEEETVRFSNTLIVPYTNNQAERDLRMNKVHQKISGCLRSLEGAKIHCRIRSFISTALKHNMTASEALAGIFSGSPLDFCEKWAE